MNIFTYWEGPKPPYIEACLESLKHYHPEAQILDRIRADEIVGDILHKNYQLLESPAQRSDCIRAALLHKFGGWWVDADTMWINRNLTEYCLNIDNLSFDLFYSKWDDGRALTGYIYGVKGSAVTKDWLYVVNKFLAANNNQCWTGYGEKLLNPLIFGKHASTCHNIPRSIFLPINIDRIPFVFLEEVNHKAFIKKDTVAIGLNNSWFADNAEWVLTASVKYIKSTFTLLGSVFNATY